MKSYNLTDKALEELIALRDELSICTSAKRCAEIRREMFPYVQALKQCGQHKKIGESWDKFCRTRLCTPASTWRSIWERGLNFFGAIFPGSVQGHWADRDLRADLEESETAQAIEMEKEMSSTLC